MLLQLLSFIYIWVIVVVAEWQVDVWGVHILCRWGQVFILDAVADYIPKDEREAQSICERVTPRLAHANSAVVLSAIKVLIAFDWTGA